MKKLLVILLLAPVFAQAQIKQYIGANNTYVEARGKLQADSGMIPMRDTTVHGPLSDSLLFAYKNRVRYIYDGTKYVPDTAGMGNLLGRSQRSVTGNGQSTNPFQFVNDSVFLAAPNLPWIYGLDSTGRFMYQENKYVLAKQASDLRKLRNCDTAHIYRLIANKIAGDFYYDPSDASTVDDSVMTIVTPSGQRLKRYVYDRVLDVRWFGAKADGTTDDTQAWLATFRAAKKYFNATGCEINSQGVGLINPSLFDPNNTYPSGTTTVYIGDLKTTGEWIVPASFNIIGRYGTSFAVSFSKHPRGSIQPQYNDTTKAVLRLIGSGQSLISDINIGYYSGKTIWIDGASAVSGAYTTAFKSLLRVAVNSGNAATSIPLAIEHAIWTDIKDCAFNSLTGSPYCVKIFSSQATRPAYKTDMAGTGIITMRDCNISGAPIYVGATANTGSIVGNIEFNNIMYESGSTSPFVFDSRLNQVARIYISRVEVADATLQFPLINNMGYSTSDVMVNGAFSPHPNGIVATGNPIRGYKIDGTPLYAYWGDPQATKSFYQTHTITSESDIINSYAGWMRGIQTAPFGSPVAAVIKTDTVTGNRAPDGSMTALSVTTYGTTIWNSGGVDLGVDTGDIILAGAWVRSKIDSTIASSPNLPLSFTTYLATFDGTGGVTLDMPPRSFYMQKQGWTLCYGADRVATRTGVMSFNFEIRPQTGVPLLVWKPFVYIIKRTAAQLPEVYAWAKATLGNFNSAVQQGQSGISGTVPFLIGDSTSWSNTTKKWYQNTTIPYTSADSFAVMTFRETQRRYSQTLTYAQNATNNNLGLVNGNSVNFLPATSTLSGLLDTLRAKFVDSLKNRLIALGSQNLTYTQNATNNTLAISGGNTQTFLPATTNLAGLMDTTSKRFLDSVRLKQNTTNIINSKLGDTTFRTTGPGLAANTIQFKGLIAGNGMTNTVTDSTIKYGLGGALVQNTTINSNGYYFALTGAGGVGLGVIPTAKLTVGGDYSLANTGTGGAQFSLQPVNITNTSTAASGTVPSYAIASFLRDTLAATNTNITYSQASTLYIDGPPIRKVGGNVTLTDSFALTVNSGKTQLAGDLIANGLNKLTGGYYNNAIGSTLSIGGTIGNTVTLSNQTASTDYATVNIQQNTLTATNTNVTYGKAHSLYISGPPVPGTNVSISNQWSLYVAGGNSLFAGTLNLLHDRGIGGAPTIGTLGTNVSASTSISGTDKYFTISLVTTGAVSGNLGTITFYTAWLNTPICVYSAANTGTASTLAGTAGQYVVINGASTTTATLFGNITAAGTYTFNVYCGHYGTGILP